VSVPHRPGHPEAGADHVDLGGSDLDGDDPAHKPVAPTLYMV